MKQKKKKVEESEEEKHIFFYWEETGHEEDIPTKNKLYKINKQKKSITE